MGTNDRDYWREKYNKTTNYTEKSDFRVGSSDPTHWREDELHSMRQDRKTASKKGRTLLTTIFFWGCFFLSIYYAYKYFEQPNQTLRGLRLPILHQPAEQKTPISVEVERLHLESQRLELERQRLEAQERREAAKAVAWANYYQPSAFCKANATVECANAHIRARRKFDDEWRE